MGCVYIIERAGGGSAYVGKTVMPLRHRVRQHVEAVIGPTKDTTFSWTMHIDDALEAGLIAIADG